MKSRGGRWLWLIFILFPGVLWTGDAAAFSVRMTYGFAPGEVYKVTEQYHDVGKTVTVMDMLGQPQKFETASDQVSSGIWTAKAVGRDDEGVRLAVEYGEHKGGQRWSANKIRSDDIFSRSSAEVVISPLEGLVGSTVKPAGDPAVELVYKSRFAWMPLPDPGRPNTTMLCQDSFNAEPTARSNRSAISSMFPTPSIGKYFFFSR